MPGRHRKPVSPAPLVSTVSAVVASGAFAVVLPATAHADESPTGIDWAPVIQCESGGNPHATNPSSTASGALQFLDSTWRALGGTRFGPRAMDATLDEQVQIADLAYSRSGLTPWAASRGCWSRRIGQRSYVPQRATQGAPISTLPPAPAGGRRSYRVVAGDVLSRIAVRYGTTYQAIQAANAAVVNPNEITVGQLLSLP